VLACYSFGKAQRILSGVDPSIGPIIVHGAVDTLNRAYRQAGVDLPETTMVTEVKDRADLRRALVICPPSAVASPWMRRFGDAGTAFASGWMQVRGNRRRGGWNRGFVLSDHADWPGLLGAISATGAGRVIVTHGSSAVMVRYLTEHGLQAQAFETEYGGDAVEADSDAAGTP
jgi:putative mRNA 3-end processing factor